MQDWHPDKAVNIGTSDAVYFWLVPANASGRWEWTMPAAGGRQRCALDMRQRFQEASGILTLGTESLSVSAGRIAGDRVVFVADRGGRPLRFTGRITGNTFIGTVRDGNAGDTEWRATRDAATRREID
jgi:hypothetical protein